MNKNKKISLLAKITEKIHAKIVFGNSKHKSTILNRLEKNYLTILKNIRSSE